MEVILVDGPNDAAHLLADTVEDCVAHTSPTSLGVATGSTPVAGYSELVRRHRAGVGPSYADTTFFTLDEYVGLAADSPATYRATIARDLTDPLGVAADRVHGPDTTPSTLQTAGERYEQLIAEAGGIDLQIVGIGTDGHIGFNEPSSSLASRTRFKTLAHSTRVDNARFFDSIDEVPHHALTQGLGTIMDARKVLLVATGPTKASAVAATIEGPMAARCPASVLQMHPHVVAVVDAEAASQLQWRNYYREAFDGKMGWQGQPGQ